MKQIIIALSGRKCSGKNTICGWIKQHFTDRNLSVMECSFADTLKHFCIETLGLKPKQCYGSDEDKNTPTPYLWEDVGDLYLRWKFAGCKWKQYYSSYHSREEFWYNVRACARNPLLMTGAMTGREIMQLFGTELVRETFGNVWAAATIRKIKCSGCDVAIITDNRFPNEVESVLKEPYGYVVRLTRAPFKGDEHPSEASLDGFNWDRERCFVLDNANMDIEEQSIAIVPILQQIEGGF
jgi:hypothetical protein